MRAGSVMAGHIMNNHLGLGYVDFGTKRDRDAALLKNKATMRT